ncbi:MAG: ATP-binding cassette domain-containing protein, partial [Pseudomonadota bacterium]
MSDQAPPVIEVEGLVTHYGRRKILDGVDLKMSAGEIRVIMGGSGSGKSTLLWHLLGLYKPTAGTIRLLDQNITEISTQFLTQGLKLLGADLGDVLI